MNRRELQNEITAFVRTYPETRHTATRWQDPLVAFAAADDPLFLQLKEVVSPTHALPGDFIADAQTVIAFFIPFVREINFSNVGDPYSSEAWARAYIETNRLIRDLNGYIQERLRQCGYESSNLAATHNFDEKTLVSDWSHKHVGYIAGLGNFGLHQMLITNRGCSGRLGSIVTNLKVEPTPRPDREYCLYRKNGSCGRCIRQCPNRALTVEGFDRHRCYERCLDNARRYERLGLADVCGKCLAHVPCAFANPVKHEGSEHEMV